MTQNAECRNWSPSTSDFVWQEKGTLFGLCLMWHSDETVFESTYQSSLFLVRKDEFIRIHRSVRIQPEE